MILAFMIVLLVVGSIVTLVGMSVTTYVVLDNRKRKQRRVVRQAQERTWLAEQELKHEVLQWQINRVIEARIQNLELPEEVDSTKQKKKQKAEAELLTYVEPYRSAASAPKYYGDIEYNQ